MSTNSSGQGCDVAVAGGGPAGVAAAVTLVRLGLHVILLDAARVATLRPAEALPPSARGVLRRLHLDVALGGEAVAPSFGNRSAWGADAVRSRAFVFDPYGAGLLVDRRRFDEALVTAARDAGVDVRPGVRVRSLVADGGWQLETTAGPLRASALVDATGRRSRLGRALGAERETVDHLVGVAVTFRRAASEHPGVEGTTLVEAVEDGWWYAAPVPPDGLAAVLMTDADICRGRRYTDLTVWRSALERTSHVRHTVGGAQHVRGPHVAAASTHRLHRRETSAPWLAAGDAALATDPLSGAGILRALVTGEAAGHCLAHRLLGRARHIVEYEAWLDRQFGDVVAESRRYHALETRWPASPFWRRRHHLLPV